MKGHKFFVRSWLYISQVQIQISIKKEKSEREKNRRQRGGGKGGSSDRSETAVRLKECRFFFTNPKDREKINTRLFPAHFAFQSIDKSGVRPTETMVLSSAPS